MQNIKVILDTSLDPNRLKRIKVKYIELKTGYFNIIFFMVSMKKSKYF